MAKMTGNYIWHLKAKEKHSHSLTVSKLHDKSIINVKYSEGLFTLPKLGLKWIQHIIQHIQIVEGAVGQITS